MLLVVARLVANFGKLLPLLPTLLAIVLHFSILGLSEMSRASAGGDFKCLCVSMSFLLWQKGFVRSVYSVFLKKYMGFQDTEDR